jgi:septal ring factor EnvC (AmiA/AmiB activator)
MTLEEVEKKFCEDSACFGHPIHKGCYGYEKRCHGMVNIRLAWHAATAAAKEQGRGEKAKLKREIDHWSMQFNKIKDINLRLQRELKDVEQLRQINYDNYRKYQSQLTAANKEIARLKAELTQIKKAFKIGEFYNKL